MITTWHHTQTAQRPVAPSRAGVLCALLDPMERPASHDRSAGMMAMSCAASSCGDPPHDGEEGSPGPNGFGAGVDGDRRVSRDLRTGFP